MIDKPLVQNRILITGGVGFIGSHLAEALLERGKYVTIIDDLSTGSFDNIKHMVGHPLFHFTIDTITNDIVMDRLASECDAIFHLAAAVGVQLIVDQPVHTIETNIMGTEAVLKAALRYRVKVMVASTSEVYGKGNGIPFSEDDDIVLGPTCRSRWSYAASKMVDEFLALAYCREKGLPVVIFRLFNTVGPRQTGRYGMVIPRFIQQALEGEPLTVYGDGQQTRCFLHVKDAVDAIMALADHPKAVGEVFNVGSTEEVSIEELASKIINLIMNEGKFDDTSGEIVYIPYDDAYSVGFEDMRRRVPSIDKLINWIDYSPRYTMDDILKQVMAYERNQLEISNDK